MSDGGAGKQTLNDFREAIVKPIVDEVGKAIEVGIKSVVSGPGALQVDPAKEQKKKEEELKRKQEAQRIIEWYKNLDASQQRVRQEQHQQVQEKTHIEQEQQKVKQFRVFEQKKKSEDIVIQQAKTKTEMRNGVGG